VLSRYSWGLGDDLRKLLPTGRVTGMEFHLSMLLFLFLFLFLSLLLLQYTGCFPISLIEDGVEIDLGSEFGEAMYMVTVRA